VIFARRRCGIGIWKSCSRVYMWSNGSDSGIVCGVYIGIDVCGMMGITGMVWKSMCM
jgi:hypothetical protein